MKTMLLRGLVPFGLLVLCLSDIALAPAALAQTPPSVAPELAGSPPPAMPPGVMSAIALRESPALPPRLVTGTAVVTDQPDYAPGATAHIRGQDFQAGETVRLQVLHADGTPSSGDDHQPWTIVAGANGSFQATWHVCQDDCVGSSLRLTAVGLVSGKTAQALFTDAPAAPTFEHLKSFGTPSAGASPLGGLIRGTGGYLYGTARYGGATGYGTVYRLNPDGTGFTVLKGDFDYSTTGGRLYSKLTQGTDGALYGTASEGGSSGNGTVFKINTDGTGFSVLKGDFGYYDGTTLYAGVTQGTDGALYGVAYGGGSYGFGTVFKMNTDGTGFSVLKNFNGFDYFQPYAGLTRGTDGALYGTATFGGSGGAGTVFKLNPDGTGITVLKNFDNSIGAYFYYTELIQGTDGALYGTASYGGSTGGGTVFKLNPDGTGFTVLKGDFNSTTGVTLYSGLMQGTDGTLYGTTYSGGSFDYGTAFKLNPDGTGFAVLKNFDDSTGGRMTGGELVQGTDGAIYGTTANYGPLGGGTVFKLNTDGTGFSILKALSYGADFSVEGGSPQSGVMQGTDGALYGTTSGGGGSGLGTVFKLNPNGTGFTVLKNDFNNSTTGAFLYGGLVLGMDGALYGEAGRGGSFDSGTAFKLNTDGTGFSVLENFDYRSTGATPVGTLIRGTDGALYGTTVNGGAADAGTVIRMNPDGSGLTVLKSLGKPSPGAYPRSELCRAADGALYGTTSAGGFNGAGTVFRTNPDGSGFAILKYLDSTTGRSPFAGLLQGTDGALYGTTYGGGSNGAGTVFKLNTDGTGFTVLANLDYSTTGYSPYGQLIQGTDGALYGMANQGGSNGSGTIFKLNSDGTAFSVLLNLYLPTTGANPVGGLIQGADGALYGTASYGGSSFGGTIFRLNTDGSAFTVLQNLDFYTNGGYYPYGGLIQGTDGALYGTALQGGTFGGGTVFKLNPDGTGFTVLENFVPYTTGGYPNGAELIQGTDGALYGTASSAGSTNFGTVFKLNTDGNGFSVLKTFNLSDGFQISAGLTQGTDGALYGTASLGGSSSGGTVFKLNTDGTGFSVLENLSFGPDSSDGWYPYAGLIQGTDGALYGTASSGGSNGNGTVFKLNTDGTGFTVLKSDFDYSTTGAVLYGGLMQGLDGALYGTAYYGGAFAGGTVFKLNTDGTGFSVLKNFDYYTTGGYLYFGALVQRANGTIYGTATNGGSNYGGTVFQLNPDGSEFSVILNFDNATVGRSPVGGLTKGTDGNLYGTTGQGGLGAGTVYRLVFGGCAGAVDGTACDDGNVCTQTDTCQAGTCTGANPVVCAAMDQCHTAGTCDTGTGTCSNPARSDGTSCNDGNACTQTDACQAGACVGADPITCTASDQCHTAGTCNTGTGVCSNPAKANGTSCNDGSICTQTDTCQLGVCTGGNYSWSGVLQPINAIAPMSVFKLGSTIPTKFQLTGACSNNTTLVANIYFYKVTSSEGPVNEATSTSAADTGTTFRYSGGQYIFNLGTKGLSEGSWNLGIDLHDGVGIRVVSVGLRK